MPEVGSLTHDFWHIPRRRALDTIAAVRVNGTFNVAAFAGWMACNVPGLIDLAVGRVTGARAMAWSAAFLVFGIAYAGYLRSPTVFRSPRALPLVVTQAIAGFTMVAAAVGMTKYLCGISLTIVAGELPLLVAPRLAWTWSVIQSVVLAAMFWRHFGWVGGVSGGGAFAGFHLFAVAQGLLKRSEREARDELAMINAELRATRVLLAEASRSSERLRISRDLHDALGHHLTALSIQLDVAARRVDGEAAADLREAHAITRLLLSDVRSVVSELRQSSRIDLMTALRPLMQYTRSMSLHLDGPDALVIDGEAAQAVMRSVQEIITNAARHSGASNLWITLGYEAGRIDLHARDDGRGASGVHSGHGLTGMRERFEEHGGAVEFTTAPGRGFEIHGFLQRPEKAT